MKAKANNIERILRKYTSAESVKRSMDIMRKLDTVGEDLTQRQAAQLAYLACAATDDTRTRSALAMQRSNTPAAAIVSEVQRQIEGGTCTALGRASAQMVRDIAQAYKGSARSNTTTPGLIDGQRIQVRGGARKDWKRYAADYVID